MPVTSRCHEGPGKARASTHLRWLERVVWREVDLHHEHPARVGAVWRSVQILKFQFDSIVKALCLFAMRPTANRHRYMAHIIQVGLAGAESMEQKGDAHPIIVACQWKRSSGDVGPAHQRLSQARNRFLERPPGSSCQPCDNQPQLRARRISDRKRCTARHPAWQRTSAARSGRVFLEVLQFLSSAQISGER